MQITERETKETELETRDSEREAKETERAARMRDFRQRWFRRDHLIILVLAGILLFVIALPTSDGPGTEGEADILGVNSETTFAVGTVGDTAETAGNTTVQQSENPSESGKTLAAYAAEQEEKLARLLSGMEGVGKVEVMLTFVSSEELVVEKDAPVTRSNTVEKDSEGGTRTVTQYEQGDSTVYLSGSGESVPYVVKTLNPRVEGVLVVAEGAGDGTVNRNITEIAQALYGVEAHKVKVVSMKAQSTGNTAGSTVHGTVSGSYENVN